jgi:hypothetical protein
MNKLCKTDKKRQELIKKIKPFIAKYRRAEDIFSSEIAAIEDEMAKAVGIEDIEFFLNDGLAGVGNASRTLGLIHTHELEEENG